MGSKWTDEERCLRRIYSLYKAKAKQRGIRFFLSRKELTKLVTSPCHYCGAEKSNQLKYRGLKYSYNGIDRIFNDKDIGYCVGNVFPSCKFCNSIRGSMKFETWANYINAVAENWGGKTPFPDIDSVDYESQSFFNR